jgi:hypothetical protein
MEAIAHAAGGSGIWLGVWDGSDAAGNEALLADTASGATRLCAPQGLDALAGRVAEAVATAAGPRESRGRAARRWSERQSHFLYTLLEAATDGPIDSDHFLDFADLDRWPPEPARAIAAAATAVRDATGVRDARPALKSGLEALNSGGWLSALVDTRALTGDDAVRQWLTDHGWVAATVSLPSRAGEIAVSAVLLRTGTEEHRPVLTVTPDATVTDAAGQHRYLVEAAARVRAHLNRRGFVEVAE